MDKTLGKFRGKPVEYNLLGLLIIVKVKIVKNYDVNRRETYQKFTLSEVYRTGARKLQKHCSEIRKNAFWEAFSPRNPLKINTGHMYFVLLG